MTVITRFAPSPSGPLHLGGARTALFNWLYAKGKSGLFKLRIENTDKERSSDEAISQIKDSLNWLGLKWDGIEIYQNKEINKHLEIVDYLINNNKAYYCYCSNEELLSMREEAKKLGKPVRYNKKWRNKSKYDAPNNIKPVVRLKAPLEGTTVLKDQVLGEIIVENSNLDDFIILRSDKTPTYMLSVVVDDHNMHISDVIRGDDHLTNTFKQLQLYKLLNWKIPLFSHIPLIHGADGAKLSKRHGAESILSYKAMGYLPEAVNNYLLKLGWGHGNSDIVSSEQAIKLFNLKGIGKSPAKFNKDKLNSLNSYYIKNLDNEKLNKIIICHYKSKSFSLSDIGILRLAKGMDGLKERAKNINELIEASEIYLNDTNITLAPKAIEIIASADKKILNLTIEILSSCEDWSVENIENILKSIALKNNLKLGQIASPIRALITGTNYSPSIFEVISILGRDQTLKRIKLNLN